ncbi:hypothetical protein BASA81_007936 [Batrachochytrium salamandrivorans]|nr:hypothetical protein BASA81_007936 [Batrachochytrium salamandrivorans]
MLLQVLLLLALLGLATVGGSPMTASLPAHAPTQKRVLVLLDDPELKTQASNYFEQLGQLGFQLKFRKVSDASTLVFKTNGEFDFDSVILWFSKATNCHERSVHNVLEFIDNGGNLLLASNGKSNFASEVAFECGVQLGSLPVRDRFTEQGETGQVITVPWKENVIVGRGEGEVKYIGTWSEPSKEASALGAIQALVGAMTTYSKEQKYGSHVSLISSVQMKNNARVSIAGSVEMFTNALGNLEYAKRLSLWTFGESGVLRVDSWRHGKQNGDSFVLQKSHKSEMAHKNLPRSHFPDPEWGPNSKIYRIRDEVRYELELSVLGMDGRWTPYLANDLQVEFAMLDAYQRINFKSLGSGKYVAEFMLPDQYGTFAFRVVYNRPGLSSIRLLDSVNVRPFSHNEYERFIPNAFPYYTAVFVVMIGFLLFSCAFAHAPKPSHHAKSE